MVYLVEYAMGLTRRFTNWFWSLNGPAFNGNFGALIVAGLALAIMVLCVGSALL